MQNDPEMIRGLNVALLEIVQRGGGQLVLETIGRRGRIRQVSTDGIEASVARPSTAVGALIERVLVMCDMNLDPTAWQEGSCELLRDGACWAVVCRCEHAGPTRRAELWIAPVPDRSRFRESR